MQEDFFPREFRPCRVPEDIWIYFLPLGQVFDDDSRFRP